MAQILSDNYFDLHARATEQSKIQPVESAHRLQAVVENEGSQGLVYYTPPQRIAAQLLCNNESAERGLERWRSQAIPVLEATRLFRQQISIAEIPDSQDALDRANAEIAKRVPQKEIPSIVPQSIKIDPFWAAAGWVCVLQQPLLVQLLGELQARSIADFETIPDPDQALGNLVAAHLETVDMLETGGEGSAAVAERERVMERQIGELENSLRESSAAEEKLQRMADALSQKTSKLEKANAKLNARINLYRGSASWKITAPIRAAGRLFKPKGGGG